MTEGTWLRCKVDGQHFGARYGAASCFHDNTVYLYGGAVLAPDGSNIYSDELFALQLNGAKVYCKKTSTMGVTPGPRVGAFMASLGDNVYLYGGTSNEYTLQHCKGLYMLQPASLTWFQLEMHDDPGTVSFSIAQNGLRLYMFGGISQDVPSNETYTLNLGVMPRKWEKLKTTGAPPPPRVDHCSTVCGGKMFVYGGSGSPVLWYNDLHYLDLASKTWNLIKISSGVYPPPCDFSTLHLFDKNALVLFGGSNDSLPPSNFEEAWYYSLTKNAWTKMGTMGERPGSRCVQTAHILNSCLYVMGGLGTASTFDDAWVLQIHGLQCHDIPKCEIQDTPIPTPTFSIASELPPVPPITDFSLPDVDKHTGLEDLRGTVIAQVSKGFDVLEAEFAAVYAAKSCLARETQQVKKMREQMEEWVSEQRADLQRQCDAHTSSCRQWVDTQSQQFSQERLVLADERKRLERSQRRLAADQDNLNKKIKKLEELMNRVQIK